MGDKEKAKEEIKRLVEKYERIANSGKLKSYNEERTKNEFIEPLFEALGWDLRNREHDDEVTKEEKVSKGRVDYAFRINGIPKFFVEAKPFKIDLNDPVLGQQAINYAYLKNVTWAILTDFEGIKVFNSELKARTLWESQVLELEYRDFLNKFDDLWLLSKEAMTSGLLDKFAEERGKKQKKSPIDKQLLSDFTKWRELLSRDISKLNQSRKLTQEDLDESVQRILDRLIFIRKCEDIGIEPAELRSRLRIQEDKQRGKLVKELVDIFRYFRKNYNSGLFGEKEQDTHLCDTLQISNNVLRIIINGLYTTEDRSIYYDFSAIDADVLGNIYEQYLSHILRKTPKRAKIEVRKDHRKEHGIYYTPTYIVDYIVRNTLGEILKNKNPKEAEKIKVLDPACGSGSFLIKAFDIFDKYFKKKTGIDSFIRKSKILTDNIFGIDLDQKAVEIAQLNLLLKTAEKRHKLPVLKENIKQGNSLIDDQEVAGDKAFKWEEEFKEIMNNGGFDIVIGNPPYVRQEELSEIKPYLQKNYEVYHGMADLFVYFFEREIELLKEGGYLGMIVSNKWLRGGYGVNLRKFISKFWIERFIDFGDLKVFPDATIYPCIIIIQKIKKQNPKIQVCKMGTLNFGSIEEYINNNRFTLNQNILDEKEWSLQSPSIDRLLKKIESAGILVENYTNSRIYRGILTGLNKAFIIDEKTKNEIIKQDPKSAEIIKPFLTGQEIKRYKIIPKKKYLIFTRRGIDIDNHSAIKNHLKKFQEELIPKKSIKQKVGRKPGNYKWYEIQDVSAYYKEFEKPKIIWGNLATKASFYFDKDGFYINAPACILPTDSKYVLGVLNSKVMSYFLKSICAERQGGFIEQKPVYISKIPIKKSNENQKNALEKLVDKIHSLNKRLNEIGDKKTDERMRLEEEVKKTDAEINELVYEIYKITKNEQKIIES